MAPVILVVTGSDMPVRDPEVGSVATAISSLGAEAAVVSWGDPDVDWAGADLVLVRSPWDYTLRLESFLAWAEHVAAVSTLVNPFPVLVWNSHKGYLAQLAAAGVPTVPTTLVRRGTSLAAWDPVDSEWADSTAGFVVKPAVSAGSMDTSRHDSAAGAVEQLSRLVVDRDALVQPYLPQILEGERSLVFLEGRLSHAVVKVPAAGDYRVQEHYGGVTSAWHPTEPEREVAAAALALAPATDPLLYARVDLVGPPDRPLVIELELIEPALFLTHDPAALHRLAQATVARTGLSGN